MDSVIGTDELEERITENDDDEEQDPFVERFTLTIGEAPLYPDGSDEPIWQWKATMEHENESYECVSGTIFDAVMGAIEEATGGEV